MVVETRPAERVPLAAASAALNAALRRIDGSHGPGLGLMMLLDACTGAVGNLAKGAADFKPLPGLPLPAVSAGGWRS